MSTFFGIIGVITVILSIYFFAPLYLLALRTRLFDKYFQIHLEECYNMDDLFHIKIKGQITPKVDYLEIPYEDLNIEINTKTMRGTIVNNEVSLELINLHDRKKTKYLIKQYYIKTVESYIKEILRNNKDYIKLIKTSKRQKHHMKKIACGTCKYSLQCQISFDECNYERETRDAILSNCIRTSDSKYYEPTY
ncbi:MAG: hypothetical protein RO469_06275 [Thermincola sp.]|jgi:hypothetical protein|nr:hypothetical protein [Thermincola sp.]MDT3703061.1 hypothetical protein [Thermincola sp.]